MCSLPGVGKTSVDYKGRFETSPVTTGDVKEEAYAKD